MPLQARSRLEEATERVVSLYQTWEKAGKVAEWRVKVANSRRPAKPGS